MTLFDPDGQDGDRFPDWEEFAAEVSMFHSEMHRLTDPAVAKAAWDDVRPAVAADCKAVFDSLRLEAPFGMTDRQLRSVHVDQNDPLRRARQLGLALWRVRKHRPYSRLAKFAIPPAHPPAPGRPRWYALVRVADIDPRLLREEKMK